MRKFIIVFATLCLLLPVVSGCTISTANYDVIVIGTDPEGIAAALAAARAGANTLLIDNRTNVGGLFTQGWLNFLDMNYGPNRELLTRGIFSEFFEQIEGIAFDVSTARNVFNSMLSGESNIHLQMNADDIEPIVKDKIIIGITAKVDTKKNKYFAKQIIDATQDGDIAAAAGVPFTLGQEDIGGPSYGMAVTQIFKLGGVKEHDWSRLRQYLRDDGDINSGSTSNTAWGFARFYQDYHPSQPNVQLRGLNIARQKDGCVMINALQIFQINPLDALNRQLAKEKALKELEYIIPFLQAEVPGMENIELLAIAPELYVRESRHMLTEYRLTIDDVLENRDFTDRIAIGSYPVDMQGTAPGDDVIIIGNPSQYSIPLRCIIPLEIDNLLLAGRNAGYSSLAHGSTRMVPIGMCTGEAAGTVAVLAIKHDITVRQYAQDPQLVKALQGELIANGAYLPEFTIDDDLINHPQYEGLKLLRQYGLIQGRYDNNYHLNDIVNIGEFVNIAATLIDRIEWPLHLDNSFEPNQQLTKAYFEIIFSDNTDLLHHLNEKAAWQGYADNSPLSRGAMAMLLYNIKQFYS